MFSVKSIALIAITFLSTLSAQIVKPVPGDYTPGTPEKYEDGITNPAESILNTNLRLEAKFKDSQGNEIKLSEVFDGSKPAVMCVMYFGCRSTCGPLMNEIYAKISELNIKPGKDFNLVFVSMEPEEGPELAGPKKQNYLDEFKYSDGKGHYFLTSDVENVKAVTGVLDFKYKMMEGIGDYSHPTVTYFITPSGKISRFFTGFGYTQQDLKFSLLNV